MVNECCVCEVPSTLDESNIKKKEQQLPLLPRPEVLLLPFQNTFQTLCQRCTKANDRSIRLLCDTEQHDWTPSDFFHSIRHGWTDRAKLICMTLPPGDCVHYQDPATGETALHLCATFGYWHFGPLVHVLFFDVISLHFLYILTMWWWWGGGGLEYLPFLFDYKWLSIFTWQLYFSKSFKIFPWII